MKSPGIALPLGFSILPILIMWMALSAISRGIGLVGIDERVGKLGAVAVMSHPDKGTIVEYALPLGKGTHHEHDQNPTRG